MAAMIFGKKPEPRGAGDREGERGKVQRPATHGWPDEAYVLEKKPRGKPSGNPACQGGRNGSLAGFGRLE